MDLGQIRIRFGADTSGLDRGFSHARKQTASFAKDAGKSATVNFGADTRSLESGVSSGRKALTGFQKDAQKAGEVQLSADDRQLQSGVSSGRKAISGLATYAKAAGSLVFRGDAAPLTSAISSARRQIGGFKGFADRAKSVLFDGDVAALSSATAAAGRLLSSFHGNAQKYSEVVFEGDAAPLASAAQSAESSLNNVGAAAGMGGLGGSLLGLKGLLGVAGVAGGMTLVGNSAIGLNSSLEQSEIAFNTMLGSGAKARSFLDELATFAAKTPFEFPDLVQASKRMFAYGFEAKQVKPLLVAVGDTTAAMGSGAAGIDAVTTALGQMKAGTVAQLGEINQLTEQGIPALELLGQHLGVTAGEARDMVSEGKVSADQFIAAFKAFATENYGGLMAKQAKTAGGAWSTIMDSIQMGSATAFKPAFTEVSNLGQAIAGFVSGAGFESWTQRTASSLDKAISKAKDFGAEIKTALSPPDPSGPVGEGQKTGAGGDGFISGLVGSLQSGWGMLKGVFSQIRSGVSELASTLGPYLAPALRDVKAGFAALQPAIKPLGAFLGGVLTGAFRTVATVAGTALVGALRVGALAFRGIATAVGWVGQKLTPFTPQLRTIGQVVGTVLGTVVVGAVGKSVQALGWLVRYIPVVGRVAAPAFGLLGRVIVGASKIAQVALRGLGTVMGWASKFVVRGARLIGSGVSTAWRFVGSQTSRIWGGVRSFFGATWNFLTSRAKSGAGAIRSGVSTAWNKVRSGTTTVYNGIKSFLSGIWNGLRSFVVGRADSLRSGVGRAWDGLRSWTSKSYTAIKDSMSSTVRSAADAVESRVGKLWGWLKSTWISMKEGTAAAFTAIGDFMTNPIAAARDTLRGIWNSILDGVAKVLDAVKLGGLADTVRGAKWGDGSSGGSGGSGGGGSNRRTPSTGRPVAMAAGGVLAQDSTGGVSDGTMPRAVYGEGLPGQGPQRETYAVHGRKDNIPYGEAFANSVGMTMVPDRSGNDGEKAHHHPKGFARGGVASAKRPLEAWRARGVPMHAKGRIWDAGGGAGQYGATNNSLWDKETLKRAKQIIDRFPVAVNTYENHPPGYPQYRGSSLDAWAYAGRGTPIGYPSPHNEVKRYIETALSSGLQWTLGEGDAGHSGGERHVHATWAPNGAVGSGGYKGGGGFSVPNPLQLLFDRLWKPIQSKIDGFDKEMQSGMVLRAGAGKTAKDAIGGIHDWIDDKIPDTLGFGGGSGGPGTNFSGGGTAAKNRELGKKMNEAAGWGSQWSALDSLWNKESGWNHLAQNPTSSAYGIPQAMTSAHNMPKGYGPPGGDPAVQIDWGLGYIGGRYGDPNAAWAHSQNVGWYEKGGLIPGKPGQHKPVLAEAGEVVLPRGVSGAFLRFADAIDRTAGAAREHRVDASRQIFGAAALAPSEAIGRSAARARLSDILRSASLPPTDFTAAGTADRRGASRMSSTDVSALVNAIRGLREGGEGKLMRLHPDDLADLAVAVSHITTSPLMGERINHELAEVIRKRRRLREGKAAN